MWDSCYGTVISDTYITGHQLVIFGVPWQIYPGFDASNWSMTDLDMTIMILANNENAAVTDLNDTVAGFILAER
ncbi:hypothetical protein EKD04_016985 [Chloroflexales bacterium ZM16-3]|nr:hypothetical protein [Chloroflexales bacterium ZM16-3]